MKTQKFHVLFVDDATSKLKSFNSKTALDKWVLEFRLKHGERSDSWIEFTFEGKLIEKFQSYWDNE